MHFMSLYMDGSERPCRAEVFAGTASYAPLLIHSRNHERILALRILANHPDCTSRAMACTVSAFHIVCVHNAKVKVYYSMSDLNRRFLLHAHRADGSCRADFGTGRALRTAMSALV